MKKEHKEILKILVKKELEAMEETKENIEFPSGNFIKSRQLYEQSLEEILETLK